MNNNKKLYSGLLALVVVVAALVGVVVASSSHQSNNMQMHMATPANATASNTVAIQDYMFSPMAIKVKVGTTVTWTNKDNVTHTVSSDDGSAEQFEKQSMPHGSTFTHTFNKAGTFTYHCDVHPYMHGTIEVTNS